MADSNDILVRYGADTSELDGASKQAVNDINQVSDASKNAASNTNALSQAQATAARQTQQMANGHKQAAESTRTVADESVKLDQALTKLMGSLDASYKNAVKLAEGEELLHQNMLAGNISGTQHDAMLQTLRKSYGQAEQGAFNLGMSTSHAINGVRALTDEMASGRTRQAGGTFTRLFLEFAAANPEIAATTAAILALGGAFVMGAVHAEEMDRAVNGIQAALAATGRAGDLSRQQIEGYINTMARAPNISRDAAEEILAEFSRLPDISMPIFDKLQGMVSDFATATGQKAPQAARDLATAFEDPVKGALKLDKQLNFLTSTQILAIQKADEHGDRMKAQAILADALSARIKGLTDNAMTPLQNAERDCSTAWKNLMDAMGHSDQIAWVTRQIAHLIDMIGFAIDQIKNLGKMMSDSAGAEAGINGGDPGSTGAASGYGSKKVGAATAQAAAQATVNDKLREQQRLDKEQLEAALKVKGEVTERARLEKQINDFIAARNRAQTPEEKKVYDQAIANDRQKLARLNKPKHTKKPTGMASQMDEWRAQFEQMKADAIERTGQEDYQAEIAFWQKKLAVAKIGSKEYIEIENEINRLRISAARTGARESAKSDQQAYQAKIAALKEQQAAAAGDLPKQILLEQQMLQIAKARYGEQSKAYQDMKKEMDKLDKQYALQQANDQAADLNRFVTAFDSMISVENAGYQQRLKLHQITQEQMTRIEMDEEQRRFNALKQSQAVELASYQQFPKQYQDMLTKIQKAQAQHDIRMAQLQAQLVEQQRAMWTAAGNAAQNAFSSSLQGILRGTTTFQSLMSNVALAVADSFIQSGVKMAADWITQQIAIKTATATTNASSGAASIATQAAVASAGAYASTAAIPGIGPELAPGAAALAYSDVMGMQGLLVASAAGGWEVPRDQLMQVHEKEVILPRKWAERIATVADNQAATNAGAGAGGQAPAMAGGNHLHIHATDAKSFERMLSDSDSHLYRMAQKWSRNGKI